MSAIEYFKARKKYKQGRERQKEILKTFNRTASTNLRIDPELESERDIDFQDEKYRLKNLSIKQRRRKKNLSKRKRRRHMSQEVVKDFYPLRKEQSKSNKGSMLRKKDKASVVDNIQSQMRLRENTIDFYDYCLDFLSKDEKVQVRQAEILPTRLQKKHNINRSCLLTRQDLLNLHCKLKNLMMKKQDQKEETEESIPEIYQFLKNLAIMISIYCLEMLISIKRESEYARILLDMKMTKKIYNYNSSKNVSSQCRIDVSPEQIRGLYNEIQTLVSFSFDLRDKTDLSGIQIFSKLVTN